MTENKYKEAVMLLMQTNRLHRKLAERHAASASIHPSQHRMLMYLAKSESTPAQCELARKFEISPAAVTVTLQKLEKLGYIEKTRGDVSGDGDGRVNEIKITPKGKQEAYDTREYFSYIDNAMFEGFSDEELCELKRLLIKTAQNLQAIGESDK